jgi:hypothetical protein
MILSSCDQASVGFSILRLVDLEFQSREPPSTLLCWIVRRLCSPFFLALPVGSTQRLLFALPFCARPRNKISGDVIPFFLVIWERR